MFHYSASGSKVLITHHVETQDNVIPSSNSVMAHNLFRMGHLFTNREYLEYVSVHGEPDGRQDRTIPPWICRLGPPVADTKHPFYEIAVAGPDAREIMKDLSKDYLPHAIIAGSARESDLPLFRDRFQKDKTHIFVCRDNVCQLPVENPEDAKAIYHTQ